MTLFGACDFAALSAFTFPGEDSKVTCGIFDVYLFERDSFGAIELGGAFVSEDSQQPWDFMSGRIFFVYFVQLALKQSLHFRLGALA